MKRTPITPDFSRFPEVFHDLLADRPVYDSSCSSQASVWMIDRDGGLFLKTAPKSTLAAEAEMTRYYHRKGLGPEVLSYFSSGQDWLLTARIPGEDCTHRDYLSDPRRLCDTLAGLLRSLHETNAADCPVRNRSDIYRQEAARGRSVAAYEQDLFPGHWGFPSADAAWAVIEAHADALQNDTLLHGDYCLPNILLDNWRFTGFIDLGKAGVGDKHFDVFWGAWTLRFNLKTDRWCNRFLDAYGRDAIHPELLRTVAALECFTE